MLCVWSQQLFDNFVAVVEAASIWKSGNFNDPLRKRFNQGFAFSLLKQTKKTLNRIENSLKKKSRWEALESEKWFQ